MYLVDREIRDMIDSCRLIENAENTNINAISCDVCIEYIIGNDNKDSQLDFIELEPGTTVIVATKEKLNMPNNMIAHIIPKNSRIRMGIRIEAPVYQPGHKTRMFIAVTNISSSVIELKKDEQIAAVAFSRLSNEPDKIYTGTFKDEDQYRGLADYDNVWNRRKKAIDDKYRDIKGIEKSIYSHVMILMTIFIGIFSLINFDSSFIRDTANLLTMITYNMIFIGAISTLIAIINCILPGNENKKYKWTLFIVPLICFVVAGILL